MTDVHKLWDYREYLNVNGNMLTPELITRLEISLTQLQIARHIINVRYWGRIFGIQNDYHIVCGFNREALHEREYFYSRDLIAWESLPKGKKKYKTPSLLALAPFKGDPTFKIRIVDEYLEEGNPDREVMMREESRLAATVSNIIEDVEIAARGRFIKDLYGIVQVNDAFYGLSELEAKQLKNYLHLRVSQHRWNINVLTRQDYNYCMDILENIEDDIPNGCWLLSMVQNNTLVFLRNLFWPGMMYFHKVNSPDDGFLYIGNGRKNLDVPFCL